MRNILLLGCLAVSSLSGYTIATPTAHGERLEQLEKRAPAGGMTYQGCYTDNPRVLTAKVAWLNNATTTVDSCTAACVSAGYTIAGMEYAGECYCDNYFQNPIIKNADSQCNMACSGNSAQTCGGSYRLSVWSATVPQIQPAAVAKATVGTFSSQGCYTDLSQGSRTLVSTTTTSASMTAESCASFCSGFLYMGLEYATECYCGNSLTGGTTSATASDCNMPCGGNKSQLCGGSSRINIYKNSAATNAPATPVVGQNQFKGCYIDSTSARSLTYRAPGGSANTVDSCKAACTSAGFSVAGMEYGSECWCGNSFTATAVSTAISDCSMLCAGNSQQFCGAGNRLSVYSSLSTIPTSSALTPAQTVGSFQYQGCYVDSTSSRTFPNTGNGGSLDACAASCSNYAYFGVEYGSECYCGINLNNAVTSAASTCNMPCTSNTTQLCGGSNTLNVYKNTKYTFNYYDVLPGTTAMGCYSDSTSARSLDAYTYPGTYNYWTQAVCAYFCRAYGFRYAGMEFSNECYCDNYMYNNALSGTVASSQCNMPCIGDSSKFCGGSNRINIVRDDTWNQTLFTVAKYSTWTNIGCYIDTTSKRTVSNSVSVSGTMTAYKCLDACKAAGYKYCGVEYASECYGSNTAPYTAIAPSPANLEEGITRGCDMPCAGNSTITCGGSDRINVFIAGTASVASPVFQ